MAASVRACEIKLHRGERLLFAAMPDIGTEYAIAVSAPRNAGAGRVFSTEVRWVDGKGRRRPLAGACVFGGGVSAVTNRRGVARIVPHHAGTLLLHATKRGYVRAAPVLVKVST